MLIHNKRQDSLRGRLYNRKCNSSIPKFEPGTVSSRMKEDIACISEYSKFRVVVEH